jgi:hypothetical protein
MLVLAAESAAQAGLRDVETRIARQPLWSPLQLSRVHWVRPEVVVEVARFTDGSASQWAIPRRRKLVLASPSPVLCGANSGAIYLGALAP